MDLRLTDIGEIKRLMKLAGFSFSKTLGQNFLINPSVCPRIAEQGGCGKGVCAVEIGAGVGVLTRELAARCDKVAVVEIDERLKPILDETLADFDNIRVIYGDVMKTDLSALVDELTDGGEKQAVICANLPYYITTPVIMRVLESRLPIKAMTVMVQKEAARRICAKPGTRECGAVSYAVSRFSKPSVLFDVSRGSFMPSPNVDSSVIRLDICPTGEDEYSDTAFRLIRAGFSERRKQLVNPLSSALGISKDSLRAAFEAAGIDQNSRAENLTLEQYFALAKILDKMTD